MRRAKRLLKCMSTVWILGWWFDIEILVDVNLEFGRIKQENKVV